MQIRLRRRDGEEEGKGEGNEEGERGSKVEHNITYYHES